MEELEVNMEQVQEHISEHASAGSWNSKVGLTTALLAMCAAVSNLFSTHYSDEAILHQIKASNHWSYYQSKGIKGLLVSEEKEKERYKEEQQEIKKEAEAASHESQFAMSVHEKYAFAVTLFQVATAISAIAVLVRRKEFWYSGIAIGCAGIFFVIWAVILKP